MRFFSSSGYFQTPGAKPVTQATHAPRPQEPALVLPAGQKKTCMAKTSLDHKKPHSGISGERYVAAAKAFYNQEGILEISDCAPVSGSEEGIRKDLGLGEYV